NHPPDLGGDLVALGDDLAVVGALLARPRHLAAYGVPPRFEEVLDEVLQPLHVIVELLTAVVLDDGAQFVRHPLAPQAGLACGRFVVVGDVARAVLPHLAAVWTDVKTALVADRQADRLAHWIGQYRRQFRHALHA